jgi:hypothetical protein
MSRRDPFVYRRLYRMPNALRVLLIASVAVVTSFVSGAAALVATLFGTTNLDLSCAQRNWR